MALDLAPERQTLNTSAYPGVLLVGRGNGESYGVPLRTSECVRPWLSCRASFVAAPEWPEIRLSFDPLEPRRLSQPLDVRRPRRFGLVAIGRAFHGDLAPQRRRRLWFIRRTCAP